MAESCFQLKAGMLPLTTLELLDYAPEQFADQLAAQVRQAPRFFEGMPLVLGLDKLAALSAQEARMLWEQCQAQGVQPLMFRGGAPALVEAVKAAGYPHAPTTQRVQERELVVPSETAPAPAPEAAAVVVEERLVPRQTKVVTKPVRSGQQVYAQDSDLIVLGLVSEGAEVLADGNIHVYGVLRGRALAGARGDTSARVFAQSMEAELISIAGIFKLSDDLRKEQWKQPAQAWLEGQALHLKPLS